MTGSNTIGKGKMPHLAAIPRPNPRAWDAVADVPPRSPSSGYADVTPSEPPMSPYGSPQQMLTSPVSPYLSPQQILPGHLMSTPSVTVTTAAAPLPGAVGGGESDEEDTYL